MALTTTISQSELARVAGLCYEGETINVMLCSVGVTGYTAESSVANWQSVEKAGGTGYVRYSTTVGAGGYDGTDGRFELPSINAAFAASGAGYSYDRVVIYFTGETSVHSVLTESPAITLSSGQTKTYQIQLFTDD